MPLRLPAVVNAPPLEARVMSPVVAMAPGRVSTPPAIRLTSPPLPLASVDIVRSFWSATCTLLPVRLTAPVKSLPALVRVMSLPPALKLDVPVIVNAPLWVMPDPPITFRPDRLTVPAKLTAPPVCTVNGPRAPCTFEPKWMSPPPVLVRMRLRPVMTT